MKKILTILFAILFSVALFGQDITKDIKKSNNDTLTVQKVMSMPAQVKTETILKQDSAIKDKDEQIKDCSAENRAYADSLAYAKAMSTNNQIKEGLLGALPGWKYLVGAFFAMLGIFFMWLFLHRVFKRKLGEKFYSADNLITRARTFALSVLTIFIVFRFAPIISNTEFSYFFALVVGLSIDYFTDLIASFKKVKPAEPTN
jgi:hypothetical protein